jgi:uncharacterized membrane protein
MKNKSRQLPPEAQGAHVIATREVYEGLLPAPQILEAYEKLYPGATERILIIAEQQEKHRHNIETVALNADIEVSKAQHARAEKRDKGAFRSDLYAQTISGAIAAACVGAAAWGILHNNNPWAAVFLGLPVAAMIKALRSSHHKQGS